MDDTHWICQDCGRPLLGSPPGMAGCGNCGGELARRRHGPIHPDGARLLVAVMFGVSRDQVRLRPRRPVPRLR